MKILFAGGGTGGHIMPILALYREMKCVKSDAEFLWIGERGGIEERFARDNKIEFQGVLAGKLRRYLSFKNVIDVLKMPIGMRQALKIVKKFKPDILFSKGGYVSVPVVLACSRLKVPIILHESDVRPGRANLFLAKYADKIALGFEEAKKHFKGFENKCIVTGNPVRPEILLGSTKRGYMKFGLEYDKPVLMVMGGSQGARKLNEIVVSVLPKLLEKWQVIHLTGVKNEVNKTKDQISNYHSFEFLDAGEMGDAMNCADLVVSRAGANSLAEIADLGRPSILVPYPYAAGDHQKLNAQVFEKAGTSTVLDEKDLTGEKLLESINKVDLEKMGAAALKLAEPDAVKNLVKLIINRNKFDFNKLKKIYFVGIGGIGVSALARIFLMQGVGVFGSDLVKTEVTEDLTKKGAKIFIGEHRADNLPGNVDLVVHTVAIDNNNPELVKARELGIKTMSYPKLLGELTRDKYLIAVSGTHGKTTTTAMIGLMLEKAGLDPTVIVGSNIKEWNGNARLGKSEYWVIEADEYRRAFLNYYPKIAVILNIEFDHPDCYKDLDDVKKAFAEFESRAEHVVKDIENLKNDLDLRLKLPGKHFLLDALAAEQVGRILKIDDKVIKKSLENYQGSWRRFEFKGEIRNAIIIDDYAHHPTEVKATLRAAKEKYPDKNIVCVFQPHHIDRFNALFDDFVESFDDADQVVLTDVYHVVGREDKKTEVIKTKDQNSRNLANKIGEKAVYVGDLDNVLDWLKNNTKSDDVVITMGAGDVTEISDKLLK